MGQHLVDKRLVVDKQLVVDKRPVADKRMMDKGLDNPLACKLYRKSKIL